MLGIFFERVFFNVSLMLVAAAIIWYFSRRAFVGRYVLQDKFLKDEMEANNTRRRDVEPEFYFTPNTSALPLRSDVSGKVAEKQEMVEKCAQLVMLRFPEKRTNLELKNAYGVANLEKVTGYEENYNRYLYVLIQWAEALIEAGERRDAIKIFEHTVELGSEYRKSYTHLADYYTEQQNANSLNTLLDNVALQFTDEGIRRQLTQYIMDKKESL